MLVKKVMVAAVAGALFLPAASTFADTTVSFTVPSNFAGGSVNGFTFNDKWRSSSNTPYMEWYDQPHSLTYDAGAFNFKAISLGGWPWDGYGQTSGNSLVTMLFKDTSGHLIESDQFQLTLDNSFGTFSKSIAGVHEIAFQPMGGYVNGNWVQGSWPRLGSVTMAAAVPEPETYAMLMAGLGIIGAIARRRKAREV